LIRLERQDDGSFIPIEYNDTVWYELAIGETVIVVGHHLGTVDADEWCLRLLGRFYAAEKKCEVALRQAGSLIESYLPDGSVIVHRETK
jgi:hypothetical protein